MSHSDDLFAREVALLERIDARLAHDTAETDADFRELADGYARLLKTLRRLMRLSDRNERALAELAERHEATAADAADKARALELLSAKLGKYLSPQVYASIFEGRQDVRLTARRRKLTVFFSDLVGFTELTDRMEAEDLTLLLNTYLTEMAEIAAAHGATIDKFVGDAVMCFFGDPDTRGVAEDARAAVAMAMAMRARLETLADQWRREGLLERLEVRMGLHTGYCAVGNFGSEARMDYTILGGTVNLAARLESAAKPGEILISRETRVHLGHDVPCEAGGALEVRGVAYPVETFKVGRAQEHARVLADTPHLLLRIDPRAASPTARAEARAALSEALRAMEDD
ncbi:adenylate/guanylate cyclase domain-containing protein [Pseudoroseicyclus tamaricis]|uniref:Adenylate/guanylate cyclase domain-containing protein n=1 Tax=Pseudoroseicyclus tamaricis TaxID=2705421 RepID=A0A6B2JIL9_9RHOB|nr:adenylate/guanylate cyclase domain-containing protein [Pseudoroseicyclus tamaricis]NDV01233.1 adenylate/guanylate cyclase domain-containing protein [Pseudoroseicyclus tamaricis]